nr:hypothetical protein [Demequina sediminis]
MSGTTTASVTAMSDVHCTKSVRNSPAVVHSSITSPTARPCVSAARRGV